jgi:FxLD family lantipeptide
VIVYLWTTVARETPVPYSSLGVSDNRERAQNAAERYLRSGQAQLAFVETARTAMAACSFTPCYLRTGLGWRATADPAGEVTWARYTGLEVEAGLRSLPRISRSSPLSVPMERNQVMYTANSTGTYGDDPFDLGAVLVIDTTAASAPRRCSTDDGCTPTCASSCASAS